MERYKKERKEKRIKGRNLGAREEWTQGRNKGEKEGRKGGH